MQKNIGLQEWQSFYQNKTIVFLSFLFLYNFLINQNKKLKIMLLLNLKLQQPIFHVPQKTKNTLLMHLHVMHLIGYSEIIFFYFFFSSRLMCVHVNIYKQLYIYNCSPTQYFGMYFRRKKYLLHHRSLRICTKSKSNYVYIYYHIKIMY